MSTDVSQKLQVSDCTVKVQSSPVRCSLLSHISAEISPIKAKPTKIVSFFSVSIAHLLYYFSVELTIALHFKVWKHPNWSREPHRRENWIRQLRWIEEISCSIHSQTSRPQRVPRAFDIDLCSNSRQQLLRDIDATSKYWNGRSLSSESDSMPRLCAKYQTLCKLHRLGCGWHSKVSNDLSNHGWVLNLSEICGQPQEDVCLLIGNSHLIFLHLKFLSRRVSILRRRTQTHFVPHSSEEATWSRRKSSIVIANAVQIRPNYRHTEVLGYARVVVED